ncbi:AI-2E family transporter [Candidatus Peregrinibacteria bacterium]|nr:AI-2E family transporter [Candidatus Peregrinibacteria bacterium]
MDKQTKEDKNHSLQVKNIPGYFLVFCIVIVFYFLYEIVAPFLPVAIFAAVLTAAFFPLYSRLRNFLGGRKSISALLMCLLVIIVVVVPIVVFILFLANETLSVYGLLEQKVQSGAMDSLLQADKGFLYQLKIKLAPIIKLDPAYLKSGITDVAKSISSLLVSKSADMLKNATTLVVEFIVTLFALFFFFRDGESLVQMIIHLMPLPQKYERILVKKLSATTKSIFYGIFATALAQGLMAGIGFWIAGVQNAALWGTLAGFFSMLPYIGSSIIWFPAGLILIGADHTSSGVFLLLWGLFVVSTIDNVVRVFVIRGGIKAHPLLVFFVVFGGFLAFGFPGILYGPLILTIAMMFIEIYRMEYAKMLDGMDSDG